MQWSSETCVDFVRDPTPVPDYTFILTSATPVTVPQGTPATYTFRLTAVNGWNSAVNLSMSQCDGIPCSGGNNKFSWSRTQVTPDADGEDVTLTVNTVGVAANTYDLQAKAEKQGGGNIKYQNFQLIITDGPDFAFVPNAGTQSILPGQQANYALHLEQTVPTYSYDVTLSRGTITPPGGGQASMITGTTFSANPVRPNPPGPGNGNSTLTISTAGNITPGNWTIQIIGTGNDPLTRVRYYTATLTILTPDFTIDGYKQGDPSTETVTVQQGTDAVWDVKLDSINNWSGDIDLWSPAHPAALNNRFSFVPPKPGVPEHGLITLPGGGNVTAQMKIGTSGLAAGQYQNITVRGKWNDGANPQHDDTNLILIVTDGPDYDFTPPPVPPSQPGTLGGSVNYTLNLKETVPEYAFPVAVTLDSVAPAGGQGKLTTTSLPANVTPGDMAGAPATKQVTINIAGDTPLDTYTLTFKGVGTDPMTRTHFITVTLIIGGAPDFLFTASPMSQNVNQGTDTTVTLNLRDLPDDNDIDWTTPVELTFHGTNPGSNLHGGWNGTLPYSLVPAEEPGADRIVTVHFVANVPVGAYELKYKAVGDASHIKCLGGAQDGCTETAPGPVINVVINDTNPPVIPPGSIVCTPGTDRITVAWTTDEPATGRLYYGLSSPPNGVQNETGGLKVNHSVTATGLTSNTDYYYQVQSCDGASPPNCTGRLPNPPAICRTLVVVDNEPPSVDWVNPTDGATVSGTVSMRASASDNVAITDVRFYVDGALVSTDSAPPGCAPLYCYPNWNTTSLPNGNHSLTATARDGSGNVASDTITVTVLNDNSAPVCSDLQYDVEGDVVTITWRTDEPADSRVYYCAEGGGGETCGNCGGDGYGPGGYYCYAETIEESVTDHLVQLTGLQHNQFYHFMAESCDAGDNCGVCGG